VADIDFPDELVELERSAWEAAQRGELTAEQAGKVQAAVTAFAKESGLDRFAVEMGLKKLVRHPEPGA
jgi:hypothetical protein